MKNTKKLTPIPEFKTEEEEAQFWLTHDTTEYIDWSKAEIGYFPNLKPTTKLISLRLPVSIINQAKMKANKMDVPYQSLMKLYIAEGVAEGSGVKYTVPKKKKK